MATYKLGKLKINASEDGIAFRLGEGKIHRLGLGKKRREVDYIEDGSEYMDDEGYAEDGYAPEGYSGRFADRRSDRYDDYAQEDDYDQRYDDGYDNGYDQDGYEDGYDEDGYDDGYSDDGYYDEDGEYDDRYSDEDADGYADGDYGYASENPVIRYAEENDWLTYLLLVILPPLGIYLLWHRRKFDRTVRQVVSGVSAVWFIVALILIFSAIFSGSGDKSKSPELVLTSPTPTANIEAAATPSPAGDVDAESTDSGFGGEGIAPSPTADLLAIDATATPLPSTNGGIAANGSTGVADTVVMPATGVYYHLYASCANIEAGASLSNVTKEVAEARGKAACPLCYPNQKTYYATSGGKYYHTDPNCSDMENASTITKEAAEEQGKKECPVCIQGKVQSLAKGALRFATSSTTDKSGITVYATQGGKYFHNSPDCSGMENASSGSLLKAMLAGKTACPKCCASAGTMVYATKGGKWYHNASDCSGMENAYQITLGEALVMGKKRCGECMPSTVSGGSSSESGSGDESTIYVYGTKNGQYYHTNANCSGMSGASRYTLQSMLTAGRPACPTCCSGADTTVYATAKGTYYHSYATCSGMKNASTGTLAQALAQGKQKCQKCWSGSSDSDGSVSKLPSEENKSGTKVYATATSTYYHTKKSCNGMENASHITLETALKYGKKACPDCASIASRTVYSSKYGKYYHKATTCGSTDGLTKRTLEDALVKGQTACPECMGGKTEAQLKAEKEKENIKDMVASGQSSGKYKSGTSAIKVYATSTSDHFHTKSDCSGMENASYVTLETAMNYGKTPCSKCASSARETVYAVKGGKYYHTSKSCAGDNAAKGTRAEALAYGFDPCPNCVSKKQTIVSSDTYDSGTSGIKVYASLNGKYYHKDGDCAGSSASRITLETALNYGKKPCPSCASAAGKNVYSTASDKYYHSSKVCAGDGAVVGDFAKALALGKKECPVCIGGSESYEKSDVEYSAPADTKVYVDLDNDMLYYHKASKCSDAGMSGGTKQTLEFVLDLNYKACPFCNPPTEIE